MYQYDLATMGQSMEWRHNTSPTPKKFQSQKSADVPCFLGRLRCHSLDILEQGSTVNSESYITSLEKLPEAIRRKRPENNLHAINIDYICGVMICIFCDQYHDSMYTPNLLQTTEDVFFNSRTV